MCSKGSSNVESAQEDGEAKEGGQSQDGELTQIEHEDDFEQDGQIDGHLEDNQSAMGSVEHCLDT